jgi:regulator of sirC expression with transglutaminase-like and TPR domain
VVICIVRYDASKINGLVQLLDDPDENIFSQIRDEFEIIGIEAIPILEQYWESSADSLAVKRAENLIHSINSKEVRSQLKTWIELGGKNLLKGSILVAKCQFHNLNEDKITSTINQIKQDIWIELNDNLTALEKIGVVNKVMFNIHGFEGNREDYYAPKNSFINKTLDNKTGTPLSVGLVYAVICQGLDIPVYGVNLPHHFVLAYQDDQVIPLMDDTLSEPGVLFYINPFNHGSVFGKPEVNDFLLQNNIEPEKTHFVPCTNLQIIKRMINNLIVAYEKVEKPEKMQLFKELLKLF